MALTIVNPQQLAPGMPPEEDEAVGNGIKIPQNPVPGANPLDMQAMATLKGGNQAAQAAQQSSKKSDSGGIFGTIGSVIGKVIPFLFSSGGPTQPSPEMNERDGMMYAIGALHQRDFGGTPDTLEQATQMVKQMVEGGQQGPQEMASGGMMPQNPMEQPPMGQAPPGSANPAMQPPNAMQSMQQPQLPPAPQMPPPQVPPKQQGFMQQGQASSQSRPMVQGQPMGQQNGFMPRMAAGGPPMLQPGEPFTGEGEVNGPGDGSMGDDAIPAKLTDGEFVMSAPATAFLGVDKLNKMNQQATQGFMQAQGQVQANQGEPGQSPGAPPGMPPQGGGMMPQMPPMMPSATGGAAVQRAKGSGFMG